MLKWQAFTLCRKYTDAYVQLAKKKIKVIAPLEKLQFSNDAMNFVVSFENTTHLILMKNKQASQGVFLKKVFSLSSTL